MPLLNPMRKPVNKVTRMLVEPTAPSAVEPANRPTTATSDMLNSTCSRLERASGRLTRKICFASGPSVSVLVDELIFSFLSFSQIQTVPAHTGAQLYYRGRQNFCKMQNEKSRRAFKT